MSDYTSARGRHGLLVMLLGGLLLMLFSALAYFTAHPSLTKYSTPHEHVMQDETSQTAAMTIGKTSPSSPEEGAPRHTASQDGVIKLMQQLQQNPADEKTLLELAEHFMHLQDWVKAETFALRAAAAVPGSPRPLYALGIIQHNMERHAEAAASLRKALTFGEDPSIRYSLGLLCAYYLNDVEEGLSELEKVTANPSSSPELKSAAKKEAAKLKEHMRHHEKDEGK